MSRDPIRAHGARWATLLKCHGVLGLAALVLMLAPVAHAAPTLLGQWHLDNGANDRTHGGLDYTSDSSGNGHDLVAPCANCMTFSAGGRFNDYYAGTVQSTSAKQSAAVRRDPVTDSGIVTPTVTLLGWIRSNLGTPGSSQVIAAQAADNQTCDRMSYELR